MREFFSLPSEFFAEDIIVPNWAFDKRLSPFYLEELILQPTSSKQSASVLLGSCTAVTACRGCANGAPSPNRVSSREKPPRESDIVEETITGAIEHVLGRKEEDMVWAESESCVERSGFSTAGQPGTGNRPKPRSDGILPMGHGLMNFLASELPLPPADDAVPSAPHATVHCQPGLPAALFDDMVLADTSHINIGQGIVVGKLPVAARPMMSWRPHVPKQPLPAEPFDPSEEAFEDFSCGLSENLLIPA
jgi:hypothetical protein